MRRGVVCGLLVLAACAHGSELAAVDPAALMATAWAAPYSYDPASTCEEPKIDGQCCHKVRWVMAQLGRGEMLIGWRYVPGIGRARHAALAVDGMVYDFDGPWLRAVYEGSIMNVEEVWL